MAGFQVFSGLGGKVYTSRLLLIKIEFLILGSGPVQSVGMNFILALLAWVVMAVILTAGILLAIKGNLWLLGLGLAAFIVAVGKIGCATH